MQIGTARSGQWCVTWAHAHEVLQSHGCIGFTWGGRFWRRIRGRGCALNNRGVFRLQVSPPPDSHNDETQMACSPLPSLFLTLPASVTGARTPGVGAHSWVTEIASRGISARFRGWLGSFQWKPLDILGTQPIFRTLVINNINIIIVINGDFKWVSFLNEVSTPIANLLELI